MNESGHSDHVSRQRRFYDERGHAHLRAQEDDHYARKIAGRVASRVGLRRDDRVLEVGAGFGRFTFSLLEHCDSLHALDLSERALESLARNREERGIPEASCRTLCASVDAYAQSDEAPADQDRFDCIIGFFFLHHLPDFAASIQSLSTRLAPGGRIAFVEPNRVNPLYAIQLTACKDMDWSEEKGLFALSQAKVETAFRAAGLEGVETERFGFFPPQLLNRSAWIRRVETGLEEARVLRPLLPFLLLTARAPG